MPENEEISLDDAAALLGMSTAMVLHRMGQGDIQSLKLADIKAFREREDRARLVLADFGRLTDEMES